MILKGTGSNPRGHATEPGLHVALILGIIFVLGVIPTGGLEASAGATAGSPLFSLIMEPEAMDTQRSAMEQWLLELGFVYDETLGRVRNPFDFPRGETDPALKECFVALGGESDHSNRRLIVGPAGSGKTAQLIMLAQGTTHLQYQSAVVLTAVWNDTIDTSISSPDKTFSIVLDVDDSEHAESSVIEQLLDQIYTLYVLPEKVNIYVALPGEFLEIAEPYKPWKLQWKITQLEALIELRVKWATNGKFSKLAQFCDADVVKPDNTLASLAQTPRRLFELGRYLFHVHTRTISPLNKTNKTLLQASEWEALNAYAQFRSERKPPSTPVSSPPVAPSVTECPQSLPLATSELESLNTLLKQLDDSEYEQLLMFKYPSIHDKISRGMRHDEKINLLLAYCTRNPEKTREAITHVEDYIKDEILKR